MRQDAKKKQKSWFRKLFSSTFLPIRRDDIGISFQALKKLATTKEHEDILKLIEQETILSVRAAWIDYFLEKTKYSK